jgi:hypothetical protein
MALTRSPSHGASLSASASGMPVAMQMEAARACSTYAPKTWAGLKWQPLGLNKAHAFYVIMMVTPLPWHKMAHADINKI